MKVKLTACESALSGSVCCFDKTGTLTTDSLLVEIVVTCLPPA